MLEIISIKMLGIKSQHLIWVGPLSCREWRWMEIYTDVAEHYTMVANWTKKCNITKLKFCQKMREIFGGFSDIQNRIMVNFFWTDGKYTSIELYSKWYELWNSILLYFLSNWFSLLWSKMVKVWLMSKNKKIIPK